MSLHSCHIILIPSQSLPLLLNAACLSGEAADTNFTSFLFDLIRAQTHNLLHSKASMIINAPPMWLYILLIALDSLCDFYMAIKKNQTQHHLVTHMYMVHS